MLTFQRMDVYRCAIEFLAFSTQLPEILPKGHAALAGRLRRAALSVPLNIAEAAGRATDAATARHSAMAGGSAMECAAVIDAFRVFEVLEERQYHTAIALLERIASMLARL